MREGFVKGGSAELKLKGTSLSRDPLVSLNPEFASGDPEKMLVVKPNIDPKNIRNLKPSEYVQGLKTVSKKKQDKSIYGNTITQRQCYEHGYSVSSEVFGAA